MGYFPVNYGKSESLLDCKVKTNVLMYCNSVIHTCSNSLKILNTQVFIFLFFLCIILPPNGNFASVIFVSAYRRSSKCPETIDSYHLI